MGRKPVFALSGVLLASFGLTGCETFDSFCPWHDSTPNKSVTYNPASPTRETSNRSMPTNSYTRPTTPAASPNANPVEQVSYPATDASNKVSNDLPVLHKPAADLPRDPAKEMDNAEAYPGVTPKATGVLENKKPVDNDLTDVTPPPQKPLKPAPEKVESDLPLPLDEPPPPIPGNKGPGLGGPTAEDLPPADSSDSIPPPAPPHRSRYQSNHESLPTPPGGATPPPVIPSKADSDTDKNK